MRWMVWAGMAVVACGGSAGGTGPGDASVGGSGAMVGGGGAGNAGSGGIAASGGGPACVPNQQIECACGGGVVGYQACLPDGSGYTSCACPDAGPGGAGGLAGTGGVAGTGGSGGTLGGAGGISGSGGGGGCAGGQKLCGGLCLGWSTGVGCGEAGCTPCPDPANGLAVCSGAQCDFICAAGYVKSGSSCVPGGGGGGSGGTGGTGGTGATGGTGGTCNPALCPTPAPPAQKCCISANGPCGVDYLQGAGCQSPLGVCPAQPPTSGSPCSSALICPYGSVICICSGTTWLCQ